MSDKKYCRLCKKKETKSECGYGPKMWERYSVDDASDKERHDAALDSGIIDEATRIPSKIGNLMMVVVTWKGRTYVLKMFFPQAKLPSRKEVEAQMQGIYPGSKVKYTSVIEKEPGETFLYAEDWQKVNKKDKTDGMGDAAIKAYRRENPGSKLKGAVTGDPKPGSKDANRRKNYCDRSAGQQKMHNIDCSKTPDKAICKARRRWKCS